MESDTMSSAGATPAMALIPYHNLKPTSASRAYNTPEILQLVASFLPKTSILSLMLSSFKAFKVALKEFWRSADLRSAEYLVEQGCTPQRVAQYCRAAKNLVFDDSNPHPHECLGEYGLECEACSADPDFAKYITNFPNARDLSFKQDDPDEDFCPLKREVKISCGQLGNAFGRQSTAASGTILMLRFNNTYNGNIDKLEDDLDACLDGPDWIYNLSLPKYITLSVDEDALDEEEEELSSMVNYVALNDAFLLLTSIDIDMWTPRNTVNLLMDTYGDMYDHTCIIEELKIKCDMDEDLFVSIALAFPTLKTLCLRSSYDSTPLPLSLVFSTVEDLPSLEHLEVGVSCQKVPSVGKKLHLRDVRSPKLATLQSIKLHVANIPNVSLLDFATYLCRRISTECKLQIQVWLKDVAGAVGDRPSVEQLKLWEKMINMERQAVVKMAGVNHTWSKIKKSKKRSTSTEV